MNHTIPTQATYHFWRGTPGILSLHISDSFTDGDKLIIKGQKYEILKIRRKELSTIYPTLDFYELDIKTI